MILMKIRAKKKSRFAGQIPFYLMLLPGFIYLLINNFIPMFGIFIAFKNINFTLGIFNSPWVGLKNFVYLFKTADAFIITRNTLLYNIVFIIINMVLGIAVALMINQIRQSASRKIFQSIILLPQCISIVIVAYLVNAFLAYDFGYINTQILTPMGKEGISWYQEKSYWPPILILVNTWKNLGFSVILYLSAIVGVDKSYYEAADIDGCRKFKQIWYITLPLIRPTIITLLILSIGRIFYSDFGLFYQVPMNSGTLFDVTNTIDTYVQRALIEQHNISMSSAASVYQSLVGFILVVITNAVIRKTDRESALF